MNWPVGFDPHLATEVVYNGCCFAPQDHWATEAVLSELFPLADVSMMLFEDFEDVPIVRIEPSPALDDTAWEGLVANLREILPNGSAYVAPSEADAHEEFEEQWIDLSQDASLVDYNEEFHEWLKGVDPAEPDVFGKWDTYLATVKPKAPRYPRENNGE